VDFNQLKDNWQRFGLEDPLWAISTDPAAKDNRWELDRFFEIGRNTVAASMAPVLALRPGLGRARALDFGCGAGRLTRGLEAFFDEVVGVDVAASMIEKACHLSPPQSRCRYVLNERPDLGIFDSASFDFVLSFIVLQHMRQEYQARYLAEFLRVLRPDGLCLFQLPDYLMNTAEPGPDNAPVMEMYGMTRESVAEVIAGAGGVILRTEENTWAGSYVRSFSYLVARASVMP
jgi:SAM-dependent methyltransferase